MSYDVEAVVHFVFGKTGQGCSFVFVFLFTENPACILELSGFILMSFPVFFLFLFFFSSFSSVVFLKTAFQPHK